MGINRIEADCTVILLISVSVCKPSLSRAYAQVERQFSAQPCTQAGHEHKDHQEDMAGAQKTAMSYRAQAAASSRGSEDVCD